MAKDILQNWKKPPQRIHNKTSVCEDLWMTIGWLIRNSNESVTLIQPLWPHNPDMNPHRCPTCQAESKDGKKNQNVERDDGVLDG